MKRRAGYRIFKRGLRGGVLSFYFTMRMLQRFVVYLRELKIDCLTDKGNCPKCKSYDIVYEVPYVDGFRASVPFSCSKCGNQGEEKYGLKYVKSVILKEDEDGDPEFTQ